MSEPLTKVTRAELENLCASMQDHPDEFNRKRYIVIMTHDAAQRAKIERLKHELSERQKDCLEHAQDQAKTQLKCNDLTAQLAAMTAERDAIAASALLGLPHDGTQS